jgi:ActR/RegA family two-component response regulator
MNAARRPVAGTELLRVLIVDDDRTLHDDYERCLGIRAGESASLRSARDDLFGAVRAPVRVDDVRFHLEHAYSGEVGVETVENGLANDVHYCVAFVDMRMPPGWSGVDTIVGLWRVDPRIQIVLCTAYSDFTWDRVIATVGRSEGLHLLRKPFAAEQVRRFAEVLSKKWQLSSATRDRRTATQR